MEGWRSGEIAHLEDHFARSVFAIRKTLVKRTPDHHGDDLIHIQPFQRLGGDPLAVAQDGYFIALTGKFLPFYARYRRYRSRDLSAYG